VDGCGFLEVIDKRYADMVTGRDTYHRTWYGAVDRPGEYPLAFDRLPHDLHSSESKMLGPIRVYDVPGWLVPIVLRSVGNVGRVCVCARRGSHICRTGIAGSSIRIAGLTGRRCSKAIEHKRYHHHNGYEQNGKR